jgi:hypothetical protein
MIRVSSTVGKTHLVNNLANNQATSLYNKIASLL